MHVREATPDERPAVRNVLDGGLLAVDDVADRIVAGDVLVAATDGRLLGALVLDDCADGAHIVAVAVRPRRRGQGIGTALVEAAADRKGRLSADFDPPVRPFYEALGFRIEPVGGGRLRGTYQR